MPPEWKTIVDRHQTIAMAVAVQENQTKALTVSSSIFPDTVEIIYPSREAADDAFISLMDDLVRSSFLIEVGCSIRLDMG